MTIRASAGLSRSRLWTLVLLGGFAVLTLAHIGAAPIERAEIYFLDAARTMVESGDYLTPRYQGQPFFDKPPLTYWLMATFLKSFGPQLGAARAVSWIAALLCLASTLWLGRLTVGRDASLAGSLVLATTLAFLAFSRLAMSDVLLALFVCLSVACGVALHRGRQPWLWAALLGASLGAGFLTKGPIAIVFAGAGLVCLAAAQRGAPRGVGIGSVAVVLVSFAVFGLGWFAVLGRRGGAEPLRHFFLQENIERFAGERYDSGHGPLYYLGAYAALGLPWSLLLPLVLWRAVRRGEADVPGARPLLVWAGLMGIALSLSRGKIDYYLLPLLPPVSLALGEWLTAPCSAFDRRGLRVILGLLAVSFGLAWFVPHGLPSAWLPGAAALLLPAASILGATTTAHAAWKPVARSALLAPALSSAALFGVFAHAIVPAFRAAQPNAAATADVARELRYRPDARVVYCEDPARIHRDLLFHLRVVAEERCDLLMAAAGRQPLLFLLRPEERAFLQTVEGLRDVASYPLLPATVATLDGLLEGVRPTEVHVAANYETTDPVADLKWRKDRKRALREERRQKRLEDSAGATPP